MGSYGIAPELTDTKPLALMYPPDVVEPSAPPEVVSPWAQPEKAKTIFGFLRDTSHRRRSDNIDPGSVEWPNSPAYTAALGGTEPGLVAVPQVEPHPPYYAYYDNVQEAMPPPITEIMTSESKEREDREHRLFYLFGGTIALLGAGVFEYERYFSHGPHGVDGTIAHAVGIASAGALALKALVSGAVHHHRKKSDKETLNRLHKMLDK